MHSLIFASLALAVGTWGETYLNTDLSFGHTDRISYNHDSLPNFNLKGDPHAPHILSNKVIFTPPAPGNQRGAIWADKPLRHTSWVLDIDFRATGPERGNGKLAVWLAKNGLAEVSTSSIYTVGKFDGLALSIDTYAGTAGTIRGFLNDGSTDYKSHHSVDSLAFGHCAYPYRNLGRMSRLKVKQDDQKFQVLIDEKLCFESTKIRLPEGNSLGITAVSGEIPDSLEVNRLVVTTETHNLDASKQDLPPVDSSPESEDEEAESPDLSAPRGSAIIKDLPEVDAGEIDTKNQFADLHNRLQVMSKHISAFYNDFSTGRKVSEQKLKAIHHMISKQQYSGSSGAASPSNKETNEIVKGIDKRIQDMETKFSDLAKQLDHIKYVVADTAHIEDLKRTVAESHSTLLGARPKLGWVVFWLVGSQAVLVVAYVVYERKKVISSKKYL